MKTSQHFELKSLKIKRSSKLVSATLLCSLNAVTDTNFYGGY